MLCSLVGRIFALHTSSGQNALIADGGVMVAQFVTDYIVILIMVDIE